MKRSKLIFALCLLWGVHAPAHAQVAQARTLGEWLYSSHCNMCHTSEIRWREQQLATDMKSLEFQVRRWEEIIGLGWTEEEIAEVMRYLNTTYYGFPEAEQKSLLEPGKPLQIQHRN